MTTFLVFAALLSGGSPSVPAETVKVSIAVAPTPAVPGQDAAVTVTLQPIPGIKLNKYPKIKLVVAAAPGVVAAAEGSIGASRPPASDQLESNYYKGSVDPLVVNLPGSRGGVKDGLAVVVPLLRHAVEQIVGSDH